MDFKNAVLVTCLLGLAGCRESQGPAPHAAGEPAKPGGAPASAGAPTITATPNPVPASGGKGSTTIAWSTGDKSLAEVYLFTSGQPEKLFAGAAPSGSQTSAWISKGGRYEFRLYAGKEHKKLIGSVTVTTDDK